MADAGYLHAQCFAVVLQLAAFLDFEQRMRDETMRLQRGSSFLPTPEPLRAHHAACEIAGMRQHYLLYAADELLFYCAQSLADFSEAAEAVARQV